MLTFPYLGTSNFSSVSGLELNLTVVPVRENLEKAVQLDPTKVLSYWRAMQNQFVI
jgi:hypothetical protein